MPERPTAEEMRTAVKVLEWLVSAGAIPPDDEGHAGHFAWLLGCMAAK